MQRGRARGSTRPFFPVASRRVVYIPLGTNDFVAASVTSAPNLRREQKKGIPAERRRVINVSRFDAGNKSGVVRSWLAAGRMVEISRFFERAGISPLFGRISSSDLWTRLVSRFSRENYWSLSIEIEHINRKNIFPVL